MRSLIILFALFLLIVPAAIAGQFFLKQTLYEGESRYYDVGGFKYTIKLTGVFDQKLQAQFEVNGETTKALSEDESDKLSDGAVIQVRSVLPQESGDGKDLVQFNFFPATHNSTASTTQTTQPVTKPAAVQTPTVEPTKIEEPEVKTTSTVIPSVSNQSPSPVAKEAAVDITKREPSIGIWQKIMNWFKVLFK